MTATAAKLPSPFRGGRSASSFILFCTDFGEYRESVRHSPSVGFADSSLPEGATQTNCYAFQINQRLLEGKALVHSGLLVPYKRADVGIGPYGCARSKETEGCGKRADVGIGPYGMGVFGIL